MLIPRCRSGGRGRDACGVGTNDGYGPFKLAKLRYISALEVDMNIVFDM